jgi:hypothetical protein
MFQRMRVQRKQATRGCSPEHMAAPLRRSWMRRVILVPGKVQSVVDYDARRFGYEFVLVNGQVAAEYRNVWESATRFDFVIPSPEGDIPARIDVRLDAWVLAFRLAVDGHIVYWEGDVASLPPVSPHGDLPVPAPAPLPRPETLPLPASPPDPEAGQLPIPADDT